MSPRDDPQTRAARGLAATAPLVARWMDRLLAAHEPSMTLAQYMALQAISGGDVGVVELARRAGVSGPAASQLLASLVDGALVERRPHASDRRRFDLVLTASGRRVVAAAEALMGRELGQLLGEIPKPEVDALARLLPHLEAALSGTAPPRRPGPPRPPGPRRAGRPRPRRR